MTAAQSEEAVVPDLNPHAFRRGLIFGLTLAEVFLLLVFIVLLAMAALITERDKADGRTRADDPPIVRLSEADGFYFPAGSPQVNRQFQQELKAHVVPRLREIAKTYDVYTVEVVGHTDEAPFSSGLRRGSNLDADLVPWLTGEANRTPVAYDNVGLGMSRAVAVSKALREAGLGPEFAIVPLSAGPFLRPDDTVISRATGAPDEARRRIDIRLRRRVKAESGAGASG